MKFLTSGAIGLLLSMSVASAGLASSDIFMKTSTSSPNGCLNFLNPFTGKHFRQAELDISEMMEYLGKNGYKEVFKTSGRCQTMFKVSDDRADMTFVYSTLTGEFVGSVSTIRDESFLSF